jgi:ring-1,2-phenylacetyl-CoA epoxidase subunit PaaD
MVTMSTATLTTDEVLAALAQVHDPELPMLSIVDMGIVTSVEIAPDSISVAITPTFVGCPALAMIERAVRETLQQFPVERVEVRVDYSTPWTTNRMTERGRQALAEHGLAPPPRFEGDFEPAILLNAQCPYCGSTNTHLRSPFGAALCRAVYYCNDCRQAFEQFKPVG